MKTLIFSGTMRRVPLLTLLTGLLISVSAYPVTAAPPAPVTCGSLIAAPGEYVLAGDCFGAGITIASNHVHLRLEGHTMTGANFALTGGIIVYNASHVYIQGPGTMQMYNWGIRFDAVGDSIVEQVTCIQNLGEGLLLNPSTHDTQVINSVFSMNGNQGIHGQEFSSDNYLINNEANDNEEGILLEARATGYHINGNTALRNTPFDLQDNNPNCDSNMWNSNAFVTANQPCIQ